jgi:hypothetical protein
MDAGRSQPAVVGTIRIRGDRPIDWPTTSWHEEVRNGIR